MITIDLTTENLLKINELCRLFAIYAIKHNISSEIAGKPNVALRHEWYDKRTKFIEDNWNAKWLGEMFDPETIDYNGIVIESKYAYEEV